MQTESIKSIDKLKEKLSGNDRRWLLLYRGGSEQSECALSNIRNLPDDDYPRLSVMLADVNGVRDIHPEYGIESVPGLLEFEGQKLVNIYRGCNNPDFYSMIFKGGRAVIRDQRENNPAKRVTVSTTPTCSWCTTLKNYLAEHRISFRELDVSSDQRAAEEMVRRSGQQGVPQTDINGEMIIGFDRTRIDSLLGIAQ